MRYLAGANPIEVVSTSTTPQTPKTSFNDKIDRAFTATLSFPNNVTGTIRGDLSLPHTFGLIPQIPKIQATVQCENGTLDVFNFVMPTLYHSITVTKKTAKGTEKRVEKIYTWADAKLEGPGEDWWTTYRYQLEEFVNKLKGRTPKVWITPEDTVANMEWIEKIYEKVCSLNVLDLFGSWKSSERFGQSPEV